MPEITSRLSTALADRYRIERHLGEGGMATVYLAVVLGACFSSPQPPPLQPDDIASMSYPEVRTWLETWMVGARDPKGILRPVLPNDALIPPLPNDERARQDPRQQDVLPPGTPNVDPAYGHASERCA